MSKMERVRQGPQGMNENGLLIDYIIATDALDRIVASISQRSKQPSGTTTTDFVLKVKRTDTENDSDGMRVRY